MGKEDTLYAFVADDNCRGLLLSLSIMRFCNTAVFSGSCRILHLTTIIQNRYFQYEKISVYLLFEIEGFFFSPNMLVQIIVFALL